MFTVACILLLITVLIYSIYYHALRQYIPRYITGCIQITSEIAPKVDYYATRSLTLQYSQRFHELIRCDRIEFRDAYITDIILHQLGIHGVGINVFPCYVNLYRFLLTFPYQSKMYNRTHFSSDKGYDFAAIHPLNIRIIYLIYDVSVTKSRTFCRSSLHSTCDDTAFQIFIIAYVGTYSSEDSVAFLSCLLDLLYCIVLSVLVSESIYHASVYSGLKILCGIFVQIIFIYDRFQRNYLARKPLIH